MAAHRLYGLDDLGNDAAPGEASPGAPVAPGQPGIVGAAAPTQTLYLQEAGDRVPITSADLHQGQIGDCFLLAAMGELALTHPNAIRGMIQDNNGTETVKLFTGKDGHPPVYGSTAFNQVSVTVSDDFPSNAVNSGATQDVFRGQKEIWPQVLEKAVATLDGGYAAIATGGNPTTAMEQMTGRAALAITPASLTLAALQGFVAAGDLIVMDTPNGSNLPFNLVGSHAYMLEGITTSGGTPSVQLGNPWGFDQPAVVPLAQLAKGFAEVDVGRVA